MTDVRGDLPRRYTPFRRIMSPTVPPRSPIPATRVALACLLWLAGAASPAAGAEEQRIGRGDILRIRISELQGPDTETTDLYRVDEDGCVELPRIGRTDIADLSESEAVDFILDKCRGDGFNPDVAVYVVAAAAAFPRSPSSPPAAAPPLSSE